MLQPTIRVTVVLVIMISFSALFVFLTSGILEPRFLGPDRIPSAAEVGRPHVVRSVTPAPKRPTPARTPPIAAPLPITETPPATSPERAAKRNATAPRFGRLRGTVRDPEGQPLRDADVLLDRDGREMPVTSDAAGRFAFPDLPAGPYRLRAFHRAYAPYVMNACGRTVEVQAGRESNIEIRFERGRRIEGVVIAADGSGPVGGAIVTLAREEYARRLFVETTPDGRFQFDHFPKHPEGERPFPLEVIKEGYAPAYDKVEATATRPPIQIALDRGTLVHGRIIDEFDQPLEGATISCRFRYRFIKNKSSLNGRTDSLGRYRIPNVPKGFVIQVWAEKKGYRRTHLNLIAGQVQQQKRMPPIRLPRRSAK